MINKNHPWTKTNLRVRYKQVVSPNYVYCSMYPFKIDNRHAQSCSIDLKNKPTVADQLLLVGSPML